MGVYQKVIDAVTTDLAAYQQRFNDLGPCGFVRDANQASAGTEWDARERYGTYL
ncbi:MAG TPA: hypothetical protein VGU67_10010 [Edaphobacter sp.]|nr:hypothetical protein [Edaphobacter sp.]